MNNLQKKLKNNLTSDVLFDNYSRARYATDASIYQIMPQGVVVPKTMAQAETAIMIARGEGASVLPRGGGTSQCGQTVNNSLVIDCSKHLKNIIDLDLSSSTVRVEPGIVLDDLNRQLKKHNLWFPVDISTASRATIGGMAANNSCGGRSLRYGTMRDNTLAIEAMLFDGTTQSFSTHNPKNALTNRLLEIGKAQEFEIKARFPQVQRRVGGYNIDALTPQATNNFAHILVGSEGTLAFSKSIDLKLSPLLGAKVFGICHFGSFYEAMDAAQHLVALKPIAVELVDDTMINLGREITMFQPVIEKCVHGQPEALLVVEFAEETHEDNLRQLKALAEMMQALGFAFDKPKRHWGGVLPIIEPAIQAALTEFRQAGLNIMMSMKDAGKPVSFIEDCAVPLVNLAEYTQNINEIFTKYGTKGTFYAHASEGCLHVRPVLNMKLDEDKAKMRAIAEETFEQVRRFKGSHSGEHGDGIVRSQFHEVMFGRQLIEAFKDVKQAFDPKGLFNPNKITDAPKMDDRSNFRYNYDYKPQDFKPILDWSQYPSLKTQGLLGAVEMCNNNGTCRKLEGGAMCPSFRVTGDEKHVTRGRANVLRLALTGQIPLNHNDLEDSLKLCVSCKACKLECPTGVDMARMKIEVSAKRADVYGLRIFDRLVAYMPKYAWFAAKIAPLLNLRNKSKLLRTFTKALGFAENRSLPEWRKDRFIAPQQPVGQGAYGEVVLFVDTFNKAFERETLDAAVKILVHAGYKVYFLAPNLCCGRTFLTTGMVERAKEEAGAFLDAVKPFVEQNIPIIGLEPSCLLGLKDEIPALMRANFSREFFLKLSQNLHLFEEFLMKEKAKNNLHLTLKHSDKPLLLHGHCHQKAFAAMGAVEGALRLIPQVNIKIIESACCGMAGSFGLSKDTAQTSLDMANLSLVPAIDAAPNALLVADGTSCRHQIHDITNRKAYHVAVILADLVP